MEKVERIQKSTDMLIMEVKQGVAKLLNDSKLPLSVISMILHETSNQVDSTLNQLLLQEQEQQKQQAESEIEK